MRLFSFSNSLSLFYKNAHESKSKECPVTFFGSQPKPSVSFGRLKSFFFAN